ncbi:hypothetical protein M501DRAFT_90971 [Patellaria atrata CBS 101060]|uniref:Uncharacterized protein n=1 Tax=Patellaria atrata CBS 101060 TaxID=1346257 RepID=A0A9P4SKW7_9PEZI|nr:hypothetical protein M501DRAFT_90971 [Patellaria atrata CBS 101060]
MIGQNIQGVDLHKLPYIVRSQLRFSSKSMRSPRATWSTYSFSPHLYNDFLLSIAQFAWTFLKGPYQTLNKNQSMKYMRSNSILGHLNWNMKGNTIFILYVCIGGASEQMFAVAQCVILRF